MITEIEPVSWQDLQNQVARILADCGFTVKVEKIVKAARGEVEIDVYADETIQGRHYTTLCECKYWQQAVPQAVIHSFRTVISNIGAHKGYIISKSGFQSGSFSAAELTNIELVTWEQFQAAFEKSWLENHFSPYLTKRLDALLTYTEPLVPKWFHDLPEEDQKAFLSLKEKYDLFGWFMMDLTTYNRMLIKRGFPKLPLATHKDTNEKPSSMPYEMMLKFVPRNITKARGYRELLDLCIAYGEQVTLEFRAIRDKHGFKGGE